MDVRKDFMEVFFALVQGECLENSTFITNGGNIRKQGTMVCYLSKGELVTHYRFAQLTGFRYIGMTDVTPLYQRVVRRTPINLILKNLPQWS